MKLLEITQIQNDLYTRSGLIFSPALFNLLFKEIPQRMTINDVDSAKIRLLFEEKMKDEKIA